MTLNPDYQMGMDELKNIISSCKRRGIHFSIIELIGGEPTLWVNLQEGVEALKEITDDLFFVTNGNNPELVMSLGLKHWIVSTSQASPEQVKKYECCSSQFLRNDHHHKKVPTVPVPNSLPADCVVDRDPFNPVQLENGMAYLKGNVYYCNLGFALSDRVPLTSDMICNFEDDFVTKFSNKKFDKKICQYCLCNGNVWRAI
jgi:hypothetical protein